MSIGYNGLGNNGRLGNQMFQYAALRGIAAHRGFDFVFLHLMILLTTMEFMIVLT